MNFLPGIKNDNLFSMPILSKLKITSKLLNL